MQQQRLFAPSNNTSAKKTTTAYIEGIQWKKNMQIRTAEENSSETPRNTNIVYQEVDKNINIMKTIPVIIGFWHMYMIFKQILYDILLFLVSYFGSDVTCNNLDNF